MDEGEDEDRCGVLLGAGHTGQNRRARRVLYEVRFHGVGDLWKRKERNLAAVKS